MPRKVQLMLTVVLVSVLVAAPSFAVTDRWSGWSSVQGSSNAFRLTLTQRSPGFPAATVASDSRAPVQVASGSSVSLSAPSPPAVKYGSSAGSPYLVLRAKADSPTTPSRTTYTFDAPTPDTGWAFVLGDVDADQVAVSATDAAGGPVSAAEIDSWFAGTFNYVGGSDRPGWDTLTSTLTGNPSALDTDGAAAWFEPDVRLTSLTMTFTRRAGFPVYQTWFVSRARPIGGTVDDVSVAGTCDPEDATLSLLSPFGDPLGTTSPAADGSYSFGELATQAGYTVRLDVPDGCAVVGPAEQRVSNRGNDNDAASRADFDVRVIVPQPISGTVRDGTGAPVGGVTVTRTGPGGTATTTTAADGTYLFDNNAVGTGYAITITVPDGYAAGPGGVQITGIAVATTPVLGQDFTLVDLPSVTGTVTGGGSGVGGIQVVLTPTGGGPPFTTSTIGDGTYEVDGLEPGVYTLDVVAPDQWGTPPPRTITVPSDGLTGQDVALTRAGALGGGVTREGSPVAGVTVTVAGPGGIRTLQTDAEGQYFLDGLPAGSYTITVSAPAGTTAAPTTRIVRITAAGEVRGGQDFVLATTLAVPPTPPAPPGGRVDLSLVKRAVTGRQAVVGTAVRYQLRVRNRGTASARRATLVDRLPPGLELVSATGRQWSCRARLTTDTVRCAFKKRIGPHTNLPRVLVVTRATAAATGRVVNVATVHAARESARRDNKDTATVTVVPAQLPETGFRSPAHAGTTSASTSCSQVDQAFTPTALEIDGVLTRTEVVGRGRDRRGVPKPPPLTERGKWQLAWDRASGVRPGGRHGVVRLTAHTYPHGRPDDRSRPPALGNLLLARLHVGARIEVSGPDGDRLCYRVTRRQHVRAGDSVPGYYDTTGAPRLAVLVCSGERRGPGDWTHRTIWWGTPARLDPAHDDESP